MSIQSDDILLAEIDVNVAGTETTVFATGDSVSRTGGSDVFYPRLRSPFVGLARAMFPPGATRGPAPQAVGEAELRNDDGFYDYLKRAAFDGRRLVVRRGQVADLASYPSGFSTVLDGTMSPPDWTPEDGNAPTQALRIQARDARRYASVPFVTDTYAGDNAAGAGLEGTADDLKGKTKCDGFGRMFNVPLVCVNAEKNIWQAVNGPVDSFDAVRDSGFPLTSSGVILEPNTTPFTGTDGIWGLAWSGSIWVAIGYNASSNNPICLTSPDGVTWTSRTLTGFAAGEKPLCVGWGNGLFVVCGGTGTGAGVARISTSPDGITWTSRTPTGFTTGNVRAVAYSTDAALWLAVGYNGQMGSSSNGTAWTSRTSGTGTTLTSIAVGRGIFAVAALDSGIITSRDAITWTSRTTQFANAGFLTIAYTTLGFFAAGYDLTSGNPGANTAARSEDGLTWTLKDSFTGTAGAPFAIAEDDGRIFAPASSSLWSTIDGDTWIERANAFPDTNDVGSSSLGNTIAAGNGSLLVGGSTNLDGAVAWTPIPSVVYADTTELEDDDLAPPAGSFIACLTDGYVRIGGTSSFVGQITADIVEGATSADRTYGQYFVRACERAGLTTGDWSASDVTDLDAAQPAEIGDWIAPGENLTCGDIFAKLERAGFSIFADGDGVLRIVRLEPPSTNLVTNPDQIATAPWANAGGAVTATNNVGVYSGRLFTRINDANTGVWVQPITLPANGAYHFRCALKGNGVTGTIIVGLYDIDATTLRAWVHVNVAVGGVMSIALVQAGTLDAFNIEPSGEGVYVLSLRGTGVLAANDHYVYACGGGTATSYLIADIEMLEGDADVTIEQNELSSPLIPVRSADDNDGIPSNRVTVQWGKNYLVQTSDLAADTSESLKPQLAREFREAIAEDADILTRHPTSRPRVVESMLAYEADAQDEADRLIALEALELQPYTATVKLTDDTEDGTIATKADSLAALELNGIYEQVHARYGFGAGKRFRVTRIEPRTVATFSYLSFGLLG